MLVRTITIKLEARDHETMVRAMEAFGRSLLHQDVDTFTGDEVCETRKGFRWRSSWDTHEVPGEVRELGDPEPATPTAW